VLPDINCTISDLVAVKPPRGDRVLHYTYSSFPDGKCGLACSKCPHKTSPTALIYERFSGLLTASRKLPISDKTRIPAYIWRDSSGRAERGLSSEPIFVPIGQELTQLKRFEVNVCVKSQPKKDFCPSFVLFLGFNPGCQDFEKTLRQTYVGRV